MRKDHSKLRFKRETIRPLDHDELDSVAGGTITTAITCTRSGAKCQPATTAPTCTQEPATTAINCTNGGPATTAIFCG